MCGARPNRACDKRQPMTLRLAGVFAIAMAAACTRSVCDNSVDISSKAGDCTGLQTGPLLGAGGSCSARLSPCVRLDNDFLVASESCLDKLPQCSAAAKSDWEM